ncbi:MAG: universal stress protein [Chloroflexota bacterium]|nr:universal stress protein [Chloroflexota bacterium]
MTQNRNLYIKAIHDFREARRQASFQEILKRLSGKNNQLLSYEEVRQKLHTREIGRTELREIPLDAIIGSVGRYTDFTRDFLPRFNSDEDRWARVMAKATSLEGLPPIDVYQIGEAYFVLDGNHRVSVARHLNAPNIQAYVTVVRTKVNITPDTQPDDLIIKAEYLDFLEKTRLDQLRPDADLTFTNPGQYPILLEHIAVHRYFMGLDEERVISYAEAVAHWYDTVYFPVVQIIRDQGILRYFPKRTNADLHLWISRHQAELEKSLEWTISPEVAAVDLMDRFSPELSKRFSRLASKVYDAITPDPLESGPAPGTWRQEIVSQRSEQNLFSNILVPISQTDEQQLALAQAITIARRESSQVQGLHIGESQTKTTQALADDFQHQCQAADVNGNFVVESGSVARITCERARWADLIVSKLTYPPDDHPLGRLSSGFRTMIRRCPRPILAVPNTVTSLSHALLAYNGTPKAEEALFVGAYLASKWGIQLDTLIIEQENLDTDRLQSRARKYLKDHGAGASILTHEPGQRAKIILETAEQNNCDFILIGGYKAKPIIEVVLGSVVDEVLRNTKIPLLICR